MKNFYEISALAKIIRAQNNGPMMLSVAYYNEKTLKPNLS